MDKVHVGIANRHVLRKRSPIGDSGHQQRPRITNVLIAAPTPFTCAFPRVHWEDDTIPSLPALYVSSDLFNCSAEFVSKDEGRFYCEAAPGPIVGPEMPVGAANAIGSYTNDRAIRSTFRTRD